MKRFFSFAAGFCFVFSTTAFAVVTPMNSDSGLTAEQLLTRDLETIASILKSADSHKLDQIRSIDDFNMSARTLIEREFSEKNNKLKTLQFFQKSIEDLSIQVRADEARIRSIRSAGHLENQGEVDLLRASIASNRQKIEEARNLLKNFEKSVLDNYYLNRR